MRVPSPSGEGKGEGERDAANPNGRTNSASSTRPAPRLRVANHIERKACRWRKCARSQALWCFECSFPLTPPSHLGRATIAPPPAPTPPPPTSPPPTPPSPPPFH